MRFATTGEALSDNMAERHLSPESLQLWGMHQVKAEQPEFVLLTCAPKLQDADKQLVDAQCSPAIA